MTSNLSSRAGEQEAKNTIEEAAQGKTSAQDARNVLEAESKKAGVPAMQFNPDATPEEKAAQARAVSPYQLPLLVHHCSSRKRTNGI